MCKSIYFKGAKPQLILFFLLVLATVAFMILAAIYDTFPGDRLVMKRISSYNNLGIDLAATFFNHLGSLRGFLFSVVPLSAGFWIFGKRRESLVFTAMVFVHILAFLFKMLIDRPRPVFMLQAISSETASFPSGHAIHGVLFFGFIGYICWTWIRSSTLKLVIALLILMVIILIGIARIYVGAHWPSDVLGGYAYGSVFLWILIWVTRLQIVSLNGEKTDSL